MNTKILFSHKYKIWSILMSLLGLVGTIAAVYGEVQLEFLEIRSETKEAEFLVSPVNFTDEIACLILIAGLLLWGFSAEKVEDERIAQMRLNALQWSMFFHYVFLAICIIFIHGLKFLNILFLNVFLPLIVFIVRFNWVMFLENKRLK